MRKLFFLNIVFSLLYHPFFESHAQQLELLATDLLNPRGVVVLSPYEFVLIEAGSGDTTKNDGRITHWHDKNRDGDFADADETRILLDNVPSYNGLYAFGTGHDEVGGAGDVLRIGERLVFTFDSPATSYLADGLESDIRIQTLGLDGELGKVLLQRVVTLNSLTYNPKTKTFYVIESGYNALLQFREAETFEYLSSFLPLEHGQQAVPSGVALEPSTGDLLVTLFSGQVYNGNSFVSYAVGDSKIVRVNAKTGAQSDEITGLTTAVDVAVDEEGNIFVLELTTGEALEKLAPDFSLFDPDSPPLPGGYPRNSGRLTFFPKDNEAVVLLEHLDSPTNITYAHNALYISTGQGTPGRRVLTPDGEIQVIIGELYRINGWPESR